MSLTVSRLLEDTVYNSSEDNSRNSRTVASLRYPHGRSRRLNTEGQIRVKEVSRQRRGKGHGEVLHRVLFPNAHGNGFQKKKLQDRV